jgi:hypothetical protein
MSTPVTSPLTVHEVRRLGPASVNVIQRNAGKPAIAAYAPRLVPVVDEVLTAIRSLTKLKADQVALMAKSDEQTAVLNGAMLGWSAHLVRDIEGFDLGAFTRDASLTFDVVHKALGLLQLIEEKDAALPYREALRTELTARIDGANGAESSAVAARVALQEKQREVRELTARFQRELVSLRRTVRAVLWSSHIDYQRLRMPVRATAAEPPSDTTETEPDSKA